MNVLILSPHTDDAELGAGGFISRLKREGHNLFWVSYSIAEDSVDGPDKEVHLHEFEGVLGLMGVQGVTHRFPVRRFDIHRQQILDELVELRKANDYDLVIGPSKHDFHQDHKVIVQEMVRAFKNSASIISYELPHNHTRFDADMVVRLTSEDFASKIRMLKMYKSMKHKPYFSFSFLQGLAHVRGSQVGCRYGEAFEVIRWVY